MTTSRKTLSTKRAAPPAKTYSDDEDSGSEVQRRPCPSTEKGSKHSNDKRHVQGRSKEKGQARKTTPAPKKRHKPHRKEKVQEDDDGEECEGQSITCSADSDSGSSSDSEDDDTTPLSEEPTTPRRQTKSKMLKGKEKLRKAIVLVDKRGTPYGKEAKYLADDVKAFAKGLNPAYGWADQPLHERQRFFDRVYAEWDVGGEQTEINPSWFPQFVTKTLINIRHNLCKLIDAGNPRPPEVDVEVWDTLCEKRKSQKSQEKSQQMRAITKGRSMKEAQMRAIEKTVIAELTLLLKRIPYESEVQEATEKEYARRQEEAKMKAVPKYATDIEDMRARTSTIEQRLARMENMIRQLIPSRGESNPQQQILSGEPGGCALSDVFDGVANDRAGTQHCALDVGEDGVTNVDDTIVGDGDAAKKVDKDGKKKSAKAVAKNAKKKVDKDGKKKFPKGVAKNAEEAAETTADSDSKMYAAEDVAEDTKNDAGTGAAEVAEKDAMHCIGDPYSIED